MPLDQPLLYNQAMIAVREVTTPEGLVFRLIHGDITQSPAEAIMNAANAQLQHGGGVAGAIARAGGPTIQAESDEWVKKNGPISHDSPAITSAGNLHCRYVIHAVGPIWGEGDETQKLSTAVESALRLADEHGIQSLALPAISTGIYGFPKELGAEVILDALLDFPKQYPETSLSLIEITLIDEPSVSIFAAEFDNRWGHHS
jgi:O-acetyl-ADP-ribose deacetylase (regulator of RNase III)